MFDACYWDAVFEALNELPSAQHPSTDIMRVRPWCLDGAGASFRQTVLLSSFNFPEANALMGRACSNWAGRAVLRQQHPVCSIMCVRTSVLILCVKVYSINSTSAGSREQPTSRI